MRRTLAIVALVIASSATSAGPQTYADAGDDLTALFCTWTATNQPPAAPPPPAYCENLPALPSAEDSNKQEWAWFEAIRKKDYDLGHERSRAWIDAKLSRQATRRMEADLEDGRLKAEEAAAAKRRAHQKRAATVASIPKMAVEQLCSELRSHKTEAAFQTLVDRKSFSGSDLSLINAGRVQVGMSESAMLCALGPPSSANRSIGSWGTHVQYVYRASSIYVYTENGKVTSWQD